MGILLCEHAPSLGLDAVMFSMLRSDGRARIVVDTLQATDAFRLGWGLEVWAADPQIRGVHATHAPASSMDQANFDDIMRHARDQGYLGPSMNVLVLPILEPGGVIAILVAGAHAPFTELQRRDLLALAQHVGARLSQLGYQARATDPFAALTPRQREVAELAATGRTNLQIAEALTSSANTVKKHLKDVFDRLGVASRAELASLLARSAPLDDIPEGITRRGRITITRTAAAG